MADTDPIARRRFLAFLAASPLLVGDTKSLLARVAGQSGTTTEAMDLATRLLQ